MPDMKNSDDELRVLLSAYRVAPPDAALAGRILARGQQSMTFRKRIIRWLVGAGLVGLSLAGGLTGAAMVAVMVPSHSYVRADYETAFGSIQPDGEASHAQEVQ